VTVAAVESVPAGLQCLPRPVSPCRTLGFTKLEGIGRETPNESSGLVGLAMRVLRRSRAAGTVATTTSALSGWANLNALLSSQRSLILRRADLWYRLLMGPVRRRWGWGSD
jgi:hypothetical protein